MSRRTHLSATLALQTLLVTAGCTDLRLEGDEQLSCAATDDCPAGLICSAALQRCIAEDLALEPPITVVGDVAVDADRISRVDGFARAVAVVTFSKAPVSTGALVDNRLPIPCEADDAGPTIQRCAFDAREFPAEADGGYDIIVVGVDAAGNEARARARVELDTAPPGLAPGSVALAYELQGEGLVRDVGALGPATRAILQFSLTEIPATDPSVVIVAGDADLAALTRDAGRSAGPLQVYAIAGDVDALAPAAAPDGSHTVRIAVVDDVGNAAALDPGVIVVVDTTPPVAPATATEDAIVYTRVPWGTRADPTARFSVSGAAGAAEVNSTVVVTADASLASSRLGQAPVDGTGAFDTSLEVIDVPRIFVRVVDAAGNVGPPARVRDVVWTASMGGRVRGDDFSNPHTLFNVTSFDGVGLAANLIGEPQRPGDLVDGEGFVVEAVPKRTDHLTVASGQPARMSGAMGYLPTQQVPVIFGGVAIRSGTQITDTFVRRNGRWIAIVENPPATGPLAYDAAQEELVSLLVDGNLWGFDGATWRQRPTSPLPTRERGQLAWDPGAGRLVTVQGRETWVLDDGATTWQQLEDAPFPAMATWDGVSARPGGVLAFEGVNGRVIFYGPEDAGGGAIFALDGDTWVRVAALPPFSSMTAIEDPRTGGVHFFCREGAGDRGSLLTWNGATMVTGPADVDPLTGCGGTVDLAAGSILVHGGTFDPFVNNQALPSNLIAALDDGATAWRPVTGSAPFAMRHNRGGTVHFNPILNRQIFFSADTGVNPGRNATLWNGREGTAVTGNLFFRLPFFDGLLTRALEGSAHLELINGAWTSRPLPFTGPAEALFTWDESANTGFGFGGSRNGVATRETYRIRGDTFTAFTTTTLPPTRSTGALVWDAVNDRAIMAGGQNLNDTWAFENGDWRQLPDLPLAGAGDRAQLVFDRARGIVVGLLLGRLFELRDDVWVERRVETLPRPDAMLIYDEFNRDLMFLGGLDFEFIVTTATRIGIGPTRAGQMARFNLALAGARDDAVFLDVGIDATAGATGSDDDGAVDGVDVLVWGRRSFIPVGAIAAPASLPGPLSVTLSPDELEGAVDRAALFVALRSAETGPALSTARLVGRQLELTLRYREP